MCGADAVPLFGCQINRQIFFKEKICGDLWNSPGQLIPHNNQPKTCRRNRGGIFKDTRPGGAQGERNQIDFEAIQFWRRLRNKIK